MAKFWGRKAVVFAGQNCCMAVGQRLYVIGDIHGRDDLVVRLAGLIEADVASSPHSNASALFLGDYVDRGLQSAQVLNRLASDRFVLPFTALRGNHEEMLLTFLEDASYLEAWRNFGGIETLHSFGIDCRAEIAARNYQPVQDQFIHRLPEATLRFLQATLTFLERGDYFFCHAGVRPGLPLAQQTARDLLWIRNEFLQYAGTFGKMIVHGHTPVEEPDFRANRINIDTGAYLTDKLCCLVLEGNERRIIST